MADRVSASIVLGGTMSAADYAALTELIALEGLSIEWDGEPFEPEPRNVGEPPSLFAHEVAFGRFEAPEAWCREARIVDSRWSGSYAGDRKSAVEGKGGGGQ